eukprot:Partr_v1_DN26016_c1_g1_i1_m414 putative NA
MSRILVIALLQVAVLSAQAHAHASINTCTPQPRCWTDSMQQECMRMISRCNLDMCQMVCDQLIPSTLEMHHHLTAFQNKLQLDFGILDYTMVGTHNSFISNANDIGLEELAIEAIFDHSRLYNYSRTVVANQRLSVTNQLLLGVRHLEVDIHRLYAVSGRDIKICHWDVAPPNLIFYVERAQSEKESALVLMDDKQPVNSRKKWNKSWLGCHHGSRSVQDGFEEIQRFLAANPNEFITMYLDSRTDARFVDLMVTAIDQTFGLDHVYSPSVLAKVYGGIQPAMRRLLRDGYRVSFEIGPKTKWRETNAQARDLIFPTTWRQFGMHAFTGYPQCTIWDKPIGFARGLDGSLSFGPSTLFNGTGPKVTASNIVDLNKCGVTRTALDQATPEHLRNFFWTFSSRTYKKASVDMLDIISRVPSLEDAYHHKQEVEGNASVCLVLDASGGFETSTCDETLPLVCRPFGTKGATWKPTEDLSISTAEGCGPQDFHDLPRTAKEMATLQHRMKQGNIERARLHLV